MAKAKRSSPKKSKARGRKNPVRLKNTRVLTPEACTTKQAAALLAKRGAAKKAHRRRPKRDGDCTSQSAQLAIRRGAKGARKAKAPAVTPRRAAPSKPLSLVADWFTGTGT